LARRAKPSVIAADAAPPKSPEEVFNEHYPLIAAAKRDLEDAQTVVSSKNGIFRAALKAFKKQGGDPDAMTRALALKKLEPDEVTAGFRNLNNYLRWIGIPVGSQLGLFDDGRTVAHHVDNDKIDAAKDAEFEKRPITTEASLRAAKTAGFDGGSSGNGLGDNAYEAESPEGLAWSAGWKEAQAAIASRMGHRGRKGAQE
jgi:hypothetical protein